MHEKEEQEVSAFERSILDEANRQRIVLETRQKAAMVASIHFDLTPDQAYKALEDARLFHNVWSAEKKENAV